jgi:phosphoribosylamine--glycine ligase
VGTGGREHALGEALARSEAPLYVAGAWKNPGLARLAKDYLLVAPTEGERIAHWARARQMELAVVGPDAAVAAGVADQLRAQGIVTVGPGAQAARLESSKAFQREFMVRHGLPGVPRHVVVTREEDLPRAVASLGGPYVVKPDGLTAGKGVWVQGPDFTEAAEGEAYAARVLRSGGRSVVLEERLDGEEFSFMAFVDGHRLAPMPLVQDYKRALEGNRGPNTGGMGSYSERDHLLPFVPRDDRDAAFSILQRTVEALRSDGMEYRGILYGGFLLTRDGPMVLEFNVRFGDPEALNALTLFDGTDLADLLYGVGSGNMDPAHAGFRLRATVVKYLAPPGYPSQPRPGGTLTVDLEALTDLAVTPYYASATPGPAPGQVIMGSSRALALVGESSARHDADARVEEALSHVKGVYQVRHDVAGVADVAARVAHLERLRGIPPFASERNPTRSGPNPPPIFT